MRFGVGLGIGGFTVPFDLLAETAPTRIRGLALCAVWLFWTLGSVLLNLRILKGLRYLHTAHQLSYGRGCRP